MIMAFMSKHQGDIPVAPSYDVYTHEPQPQLMFPDHHESYSCNNGNSSDDWRTPTPQDTKPFCMDYNKPPVEVSVNTYPVATIEVDQVPSLFNISPCGPVYKDYSVLKDKAPQDIADALLSLKHTVVCPSYTGRMSPSVHINQGHCPSTPNNFQHSYMSPGSQYRQNMYSPPPGPQYGVFQYSGDGFQNQANMFPSMSVNVSMSMNVGVPHGIPNNQYNVQQQWPSSQQTSPGKYVPQYPQTQYGMGPVSPQYNGLQSHSYPQSYSLTSEVRHIPNSDSKNFLYRSGDSFKGASRFCAVSHWKRLKLSSGHLSAVNLQSDSGKVNLCRICGKTYARPSTLKTHLRTHSGEKPYKCSTCSKSFSQAANLTAHVRTHSGEKPFRCPMCDRRFSQSSSVTTHMRTHSGERPYRCRLCKKAFSDSSTLTKHLRIHSGEKPYQCKLCLLRFSQSGNLNRHMRVHSNSS